MGGGAGPTRCGASHLTSQASHNFPLFLLMDSSVAQLLITCLPASIPTLTPSHLAVAVNIISF